MAIPEGFVLKTKKYLAFFGNRLATLEKIQELFPEIEFRSVRQTHSDICILSQSQHRVGPEQIAEVADAHWTAEKNIGLLIRTADCLPILCYFPSLNRIASIHAGWKGVANQITRKSFENIFMNLTSEVDVLIGPHIQQSSFEVQQPVKDLILSSILHSSFVYDHNIENDRFYIHLAEVVQQQLDKFEIASWNCLTIDTKTNLDFYSYRRDHELSGRNLSFICLLT